MTSGQINLLKNPALCQQGGVEGNRFSLLAAEHQQRRNAKAGQRKHTWLRDNRIGGQIVQVEVDWECTIRVGTRLQLEPGVAGLPSEEGEGLVNVHGDPGGVVCVVPPGGGEEVLFLGPAGSAVTVANDVEVVPSCHPRWKTGAIYHHVEAQVRISTLICQGLHFELLVGASTAGFPRKLFGQ